jgi:hypothetical protein
MGGSTGHVQRARLRNRAGAVWHPSDDTTLGDGKDRETTEKSTYPLRLPGSLKKAVEKQSEEDGTSINQFVATAVAEQLSTLQVAEFFADRKARADFRLSTKS